MPLSRLWQWDELVAAAEGQRRRRAVRARHRLLHRYAHAAAGRRVRRPEGCARRPRVRRPGLQGRRGRRHRRATAMRARRPTARCCASTIRCARWKHWRAPPASAPTRASSPSPAASARPAPRRCCACAWLALGATHASEKSYNNHWGVPLTLARMPRRRAYGVFEIGMNHAGEITPLAANGAPARGGHHDRRAGASGAVQLRRGDRRSQGRDLRRAWCPAAPPCCRATTRTFALLRERAMSRRRPDRSPSATTRRPTSRGMQVDLGAKGSSVIAGHGSSASPTASARPASTSCSNSLAVLAALRALGADTMRACRRWRASRRPPAAARARLLGAPDGHDPADRRELQRQSRLHAGGAGGHGDHAARGVPAPRSPCWATCWSWAKRRGQLHRELKEAVDAAGIDLVFACGPMMKLLLDDLAAAQRGAWAASSAELSAAPAGRGAAGRRGDDQGLARVAHGAAGGGHAGALRTRRGLEDEECSTRW